MYIKSAYSVRTTESDYPFPLIAINESMRWFEWASTNDNETKENIAAAIRFGSKGNDDLSRGTHTDDGIKRESMEFNSFNICLNDLGNKSIRSGFFVDAELVPSPSLYSPVKVKWNKRIMRVHEKLFAGKIFSHLYS